MPLPVVDLISHKFQLLQGRLAVVESEQVSLMEAMGRVLAQPIVAFRDSPALDVSAMDGYAVYLGDLGTTPLPVIATTTAGAMPMTLNPKSAVRIFTGAAVPHGAEAVIPREHCIESEHQVVIDSAPNRYTMGTNIRRRAENASRGELVLGPDCLIDGPRASTIATFHESRQLQIRRKVRVSIINTGDELIEAGETLQPWQIRDSNGPLLHTMLAANPWITVRRIQVNDSAEQIEMRVREALDQSDAILLTGGVSMGDTDHVPGAIQATGSEIVFHKLPIRPGKPVLGAVGPRGQLIMGLPGNPVSVAVTFRRFAYPLLCSISGQSGMTFSIPVHVQTQDEKTLDLIWFRLITFNRLGIAEILANQGSGDLAALGRSHGFVEIPSGTSSNGAFQFYDWKGLTL
ncbi:MAG: molybdopterin molybdotransferase MoeA [Planctomycetes bacterium]|nr:molybdopterin molybdotransferase MoeA [Planctomycetota bacterium]